MLLECALISLLSAATPAPCPGQPRGSAYLGISHVRVILVGEIPPDQAQKLLPQIEKRIRSRGLKISSDDPVLPTTSNGVFVVRVLCLQNCVINAGFVRTVWAGTNSKLRATSAMMWSKIAIVEEGKPKALRAAILLCVDSWIEDYLARLHPSEV